MNGDSRVTIPNNVRKMIRDIKEITGKHSDGDIYAMLKECNMDPDETTQKLLYLDTFHEVKRKRDRRKADVSGKASEQYRTRGMQGRGIGGGRGNYVPSYASDDADARKVNRVNNLTERGSRSSMPVLPKTENNATPHLTGTPTVFVSGPMSVSNGSSSNGPASKLYARNIAGLQKDSSAVDGSKLGAVPTLPSVDMKPPPISNPCPTPSALAPRVEVDGAKSTSSSNHIRTSMPSASLSGVYSSASDLVFMSSPNTQNPGAVITEASSTLVVGSRSIIGQDVANNSQVASQIVDSTNRHSLIKSHGVEKSQLSELSETSQDSQPPQSPNGPSNVAASEPATGAVACSYSLPQSNKSVLEEATSKIGMKLEKLSISAHQPVIFPKHLQVPEAFRNKFIFGTMDADFGGKGSIPVAESVQRSNEASNEPSLSNQIVSSIALETDHPDHPPSPQHVPESISHSEDDVSSEVVLKDGQSEQEMMPPVEAPQYPSLQTTHDYSFGLMTPVPAPHLVQFERPELQGGRPAVVLQSGSTLPATQPAEVSQSSFAVSPPPFPFFRHPFHPNYIPYGPYFPNVYLPPNAHQFLGHTGFPQQPSTGNVYLPPSVPASEVKFPVPLPYKPGTLGGNLFQFGLASGHGSYGSSPVGYSPGAAFTPGISASNEAVAASELKERNIYSTLQQNEESHVWPSAPSRDISSLQANYFYNLPRGQHVAFPPAQAGHGAFPGIYHPAQTMTAPLTIQSLLQQTESMAGAVGSALPPSGAYPLPQHPQINWNTRLLNSENI